MKQEEFNQDNQFRNLINLEGILLPLFENNIEEEPLRNLINLEEDFQLNFVNKEEEEELDSEDKTLNPLCVELPEKDEYLRKKNHLDEFFLEEDKAEARANLGITPLLDELKAIIEAKLVDETGNLKFGLEPTDGTEDEEAYGLVLSSAIIYKVLQRYYTKTELDNQSDVVFGLINELKNTNINKENVYTKEEVDNIIFSEEFNNKLEQLAAEKVNYGLAIVARTGNYNDLINTPTKISLFFNDSKYLKKEDIIGESGFISDIEQLREQAEKGLLAYEKFISKVEVEDLSDIVQAILDKAELAYQLPQDGIPKSDLSQGVQTSLERADDIYNSFDTKADKVLNATNGNFAGVDNSGNPTDSGYKASDFLPAGSYKTTLEEVQDPNSDGTGISFIDKISQNTNGVITPHKKNVQNASSNLNGLMSSTHYSKLEEIENGALVNIIEHIIINGSEVTPSNKSINLGQHYILDENYTHTDNNFTSDLKSKLNNIESDAQVNILEGVKVNGNELNIDSNKKVDITITTQNSNNNNSNGTIVVNGSEVAVKGLGNAAYDNVASSVSDNDAGLVRGSDIKGYVDPKFKSINDLIPNEATSSNLLADKDFVNSSVTTSTADFKGSYNLKSDLNLNISATQANINTKLKSVISGANNNDYVFVLIPTDNSTPEEISHVDRYKYNGTNWVYEFTLNNSSFTSVQWASINSGITTNLVTKLSNLPNNTDLTNSLNSKVSTVSYDITNKKITKTINGIVTDVVTASTIVTDGGGIKSHLTVTDNNPTLSWGTKSKVATIGSTAINVTMPSNPNTDTKVTSVDNHYTPSANANSELIATETGTTGTYALNSEYTVLTGVKAQRDAKGHVTGLTYTAQKIKDTNTTYSDFIKSGSTAAHGLVPKPPTTAGTTKYLREDGTWQQPPNDNTWNANAVGVAGYVAAPTKAANANMTWQTDAEGVPAWRASYQAATHTINNVNTANTWLRIATITIPGTDLATAEFTVIFSNRECLDNTSFILTLAIRRSSTTNVGIEFYYTPLLSSEPRVITIRSNDNQTFYVYLQSAANVWTSYYNVTKLVVKGNITFENVGTTSPISGSATNVNAKKGGNVSYANSAGSVAWTNVSDHPTNLNLFTNGPGYITSSALGAYLPLAGGTLTGNVSHKSSTLQRGVTPSERTVLARWWKDKNDKPLGWFEFVSDTQGMNSVGLYVLTNTDTTTRDEWGGFYVYKEQGVSGSYTMSYNANTGSLGLRKLYVEDNIYFNNKGKGIWFKDSTNSQYAALYDNGANLWIGSSASDGIHHVGSTYISAGNGDVFISRLVNSTRTNYKILDVGNTYVNSGKGYINSTEITTITGNASTATLASQTTLLQNRGETSGNTAVTTDGSLWTPLKTLSDHTNLDTVWGQSWFKKGQTYTPSGGSATSLTDTGNITLWLSKSNTSNLQRINMQLDGLLYAAGGLYGNLTGNITGNVTGHSSLDLPLSGGTMTGWTTFSSEKGINFDVERKTAGNGGWAYNPIRFRGKDDSAFFSIGSFGNDNEFGYTFIGANDWDSIDNLRIYPTYPAWGTNKIWHAGNDGANSGLDADLLDGQHGSYYLPKAGGTLTGNLTIKGLSLSKLATSADYNTVADGIWNSGSDSETNQIANTPTNLSLVLFKFTSLVNGESDIRISYFVLDAAGKAYIRGSRETNQPWKELLHSGNYNSYADSKYVRKAGGDTINNTLYFNYYTTSSGTVTNNSRKLELRADNEGGNIKIYAPDSYKFYTNNSGNQSNSYWEIDSYNGNLRFYTFSEGDSTHASTAKTITFRASDGYILNNITGTAVGLRQEKVAGLNDTTMGRFFTTETTSPSNGAIGTSWHCGLTIAPNNDSNYKSLIGFYGTDKNRPLYIRAQTSGTWGDWRKVLDSSNYTDYVYSKSTSDDRYVNITGDTMTGGLNFKFAHDLTQANNGVESTGYYGIRMYDKNNYFSAQFLNQVNTNGNNQININLRNRNGSTEYNKSFTITLTKSNVLSASLDGAFTANSFIKSGGTSSQFLKADGSVDSNSYLLLSGGILTGNLNFKDAFDLSKSNNNVTSARYPTTFCILDSAGRISVRLENIIKPNGENGFYLYARQYNTEGGQTKQEGLQYTLPKTGDGYWTVHSAASFRTALGLGARATDSTNYLPLAGGTMTGNVVHKNSNLQRGVRPSARTSIYRSWQDKNNRPLGHLEFVSETGGRNFVALWVLNNNTTSSTDTYGGLMIYKNDSESDSKVLSFNANTGALTADKYIVSGGTASQFLKADGSLDSNSYLLRNTAGGIASVSGNGLNLYFRIATITITESYINRPIVLEISQRGYMFSRLQIAFLSKDDADPDLSKFITDYENPYYIKKVATSKWEVYGKYSESWGSACLHRISGAGANIGVTVDMVNIGTSLPSGAIRLCTNGGSVSWADKSNNSNALNGYSYNALPYLSTSGGSITGTLTVFPRSGYTTSVAALIYNSSSNGGGPALLLDPAGTVGEGGDYLVLQQGANAALLVYATGMNLYVRPHGVSPSGYFDTRGYWINASDRSLKHDIVKPDKNKLYHIWDWLNTDGFKEFTWNDTDKREVGAIALEVLEVIPEVVDYDNNKKLYGLDYVRLHNYVLASVVQELKDTKEEIKLLQALIAELKLNIV